MKNTIANSIFFLTSILPKSLLNPLSATIGVLLRIISPRRRRIVQKNIDIIYGHLEQEPPQNLIKNIYRHFALTAIEILRFPSLSKEEIKQNNTLSGQENLDSALQKKKGVIAIAAHLGNWEYSIASLAVNGYDSRIILKEQRGVDNDHINERLRGSKGIVSIKKSSGIKHILQSFKDNAVIGMVIDQRAKTKEATTAPLFGQDAKTFASPVGLALKTGAPIITVHSYRDTTGKHHTIVGPEIAMVKNPDLSNEENIRLNTETLHKWFEKVLMQHPEQWIWMHQRWDKSLYTK